jgi:hypothetical protein
MTVVLPPSRVAIAGNAPPSREWYRFFQDSLRVNLDVDSLQERVDDLTVRVTALEDAPASSTPTRITGYGSIYVSATAIKTVTLYGDAEDPGFTTYYGTDTTGEKGWYAVAATLADSSNVVKSTDAVGVTSFDLTDVTVASTGGTLKKRSFDAKGRLSAEASATTTDLTEGTNLYYTDARADARITLQKGQPSGLATLDAGGKLDAGQLPALAITETFVVNTQAAMLALGAQEGDVAVRTDLSKSFILTADPPSTLANWQELLTPTGAVTSFNGRTGSVVPASGDYTKAQVGLGNVDNTSDADKPVSTAQAAVLAAKADDSSVLHLAGGTMTGRLISSSTSIEIDGHVGAADAVLFLTKSGVRRFSWYADSGAETGGYTGSNLAFSRYDDAGTFIAQALSIRRSNGSVMPGADNSQSLGEASRRWSTVYAGTGTINTSDAREKTSVSPLTTAELAAAADLSRAIGTYQWLAMIAEKGAEEARHHAGLTVQRAIEIMQAHGLDPMRYGFICYDQWDETPEQWADIPAETDEDGNVTREATRELVQEYRAAGDRYSFRTDELLLFIARGVDARLSVIEEKLP